MKWVGSAATHKECVEKSRECYVEDPEFDLAVVSTVTDHCFCAKSNGDRLEASSEGSHQYKACKSVPVVGLDGCIGQDWIKASYADIDEISTTKSRAECVAKVWGKCGPDKDIAVYLSYSGMCFCVSSNSR